jgi:hypothetical protein
MSRLPTRHAAPQKRVEEPTPMRHRATRRTCRLSGYERQKKKKKKKKKKKDAPRSVDVQPSSSVEEKDAQKSVTRASVGMPARRRALRATSSIYSHVSHHSDVVEHFTRRQRHTT